MAALIRLGMRINTQIAACSALPQSTFVPIHCVAARYSTGQHLSHAKGELREILSGPVHRTPAVTSQIWRPLHVTHMNQTTKDKLQPSEEEVSTFTKIIEAMGFTGPLKYNKWKIKIAALRMYTCCVERIDYDEFFEKCSLPDTLNSWFLVTQLHVCVQLTVQRAVYSVFRFHNAPSPELLKFLSEFSLPVFRRQEHWRHLQMCLVRMKQEGRAGKYMCRYIVHSMWEDVEQRGKVMGIDSVTLKNSMRSMTEIFYAAIFGYDEGIISDDRILAAALWRNLLNKQCDDPRKLELLVEYVRKQVQFLDTLDGEDLLLTGEVVWRPLVEKDAQSILKPSTPTYNDEGL